jgi:uracil-DNA glycosylase family 4
MRAKVSYVQREKCPRCGKLLIAPAGPPSSKILLVGEFPGVEEIKQGRPFIGKTGDVLRAELLRVGLTLPELRQTNLWQHAKDEKGCDLNFHLDRMVKEFEGKTHVLLMGSDVTQALLGEKVSAHSGLMVKIRPYKDIHFWVSPNPAIAFKSPIGEMRLAMTRFAEDVQKKK